MVLIERTRQLTSDVEAQVRALLREAFGTDPEERFTDDDWQHALGGVHLVARLGDEVVGHASVVPRTLFVGPDAFATGYVEAVAVRPERQGQGIGTRLMDEATEIVRRDYELGALGTGRISFYARLGWQVWLGPTNVVRGERWERSPDEDGFVLVHRHGPSADLPLHRPIACEERPGDDW